MARIRINFSTLEPFIDKAGKALSKGAKSASRLVRSRDFQKGAALLIPAGFSSYLLIRKYQKEAEEKEKLYKEKLQKHEAIIKELSAKEEITKERQDRLLNYDTKLKEEMQSLETEIEVLKMQIAELKEGKDE